MTGGFTVAGTGYANHIIKAKLLKTDSSYGLINPAVDFGAGLLGTMFLTSALRWNNKYIADSGKWALKRQGTVASAHLLEGVNRALGLSVKGARLSWRVFYSVPAVWVYGDIGIDYLHKSDLINNSWSESLHFINNTAALMRLAMVFSAPDGPTTGKQGIKALFKRKTWTDWWHSKGQLSGGARMSPLERWTKGGLVIPYRFGNLGEWSIIGGWTFAAPPVYEKIWGEGSWNKQENNFKDIHSVVSIFLFGGKLLGHAFKDFDKVQKEWFGKNGNNHPLRLVEQLSGETSHIIPQLGMLMPVLPHIQGYLYKYNVPFLSGAFDVAHLSAQDKVELEKIEKLTPEEIIEEIENHKDKEAFKDFQGKTLDNLTAEDVSAFRRIRREVYCDKNHIEGIRRRAIDLGIDHNQYFWDIQKQIAQKELRDAYENSSGPLKYLLGEKLQELSAMAMWEFKFHNMAMSAWEGAKTGILFGPTMFVVRPLLAPGLSTIPVLADIQSIMGEEVMGDKIIDRRTRSVLGRKIMGAQNFLVEENLREQITSLAFRGVFERIGSIASSPNRADYNNYRDYIAAQSRYQQIMEWFQESFEGGLPASSAISRFNRSNSFPIPMFGNGSPVSAPEARNFIRDNTINGGTANPPSDISVTLELDQDDSGAASDSKFELKTQLPGISDLKVKVSEGGGKVTVQMGSKLPSDSDNISQDFSGNLFLKVKDNQGNKKKIAVRVVRVQGLDENTGLKETIIIEDGLIAVDAGLGDAETNKAVTHGLAELIGHCYNAKVKGIDLSEYSEKFLMNHSKMKEAIDDIVKIHNWATGQGAANDKIEVADYYAKLGGLTRLFDRPIVDIVFAEDVDINIGTDKDDLLWQIEHFSRLSAQDKAKVVDELSKIFSGKGANEAYFVAGIEDGGELSQQREFYKKQKDQGLPLGNFEKFSLGDYDRQVFNYMRMDLQLNLGNRDIVWMKDEKTGFLIPGLYWDAKYNPNQEARTAAQVVVMNSLSRKQKNDLFKGESVLIDRAGVNASGKATTYKLEINSDNFIEGMGMFLSVDEYGYAEDFFGSGSFDNGRLRDEIIDEYHKSYAATQDKKARKELRKRKNKDLSRLALIESVYSLKMFPDSSAVAWSNQEHSYKQFERSRKGYNRAVFKGHYGTNVIPPKGNLVSWIWKRWSTLRKLGEFNTDLGIEIVKTGQIRLTNNTDYNKPYFIPDKGWVELKSKDFIVIDFSGKKGNVIGHEYNRAEKIKKHNSEKLGYGEGYLGSVQMVRDRRTVDAQKNGEAVRHNRENKIKKVSSMQNVVFNPKKALRVFISGNTRVEERAGGRVAIINQNDFERARHLLEQSGINENNPKEFKGFVEGLALGSKDGDVMDKYSRFKNDSQSISFFKKTLLTGHEGKDQEIWVGATALGRVSSIEIHNPNSDEEPVIITRKEASEFILPVPDKGVNDTTYVPVEAIKNGNMLDAISQNNPKVSYEINVKKPWYRRKASLTLQAVEFENSINYEDDIIKDWQAKKAEEAKQENNIIEKESLDSHGGKLWHRILPEVDTDASKVALSECEGIEQAISGLTKEELTQIQAFQEAVKSISESLEKAQPGDNVEKPREDVLKLIVLAQFGINSVKDKIGKFKQTLDPGMQTEVEKMEKAIEGLMKAAESEFNKITVAINGLKAEDTGAVNKLKENTSSINDLFSHVLNGRQEIGKKAIEKRIEAFLNAVENKDAYNQKLKEYENEIKSGIVEFMTNETLGIPDNIEALADQILKKNNPKDDDRQRIRDNLIQAIQDSPLGMIISTYNQAKKEYNKTNDSHQKKRLANALYWIYRQWFALDNSQKGEFGTFEERARKVYSIYNNSHIDLSKTKIKLMIDGKAQEIALDDLLDNYDNKYRTAFQEQFIGKFLKEIEGEGLKGPYHETISNIVDEFLDNTNQYSVELSQIERKYFENLRDVLRGKIVVGITTDPIQAIVGLIRSGKVELRPVCPEDLEHSGFAEVSPFENGKRVIRIDARLFSDKYIGALKGLVLRHELMHIFLADVVAKNDSGENINVAPGKHRLSVFCEIGHAVNEPLIHKIVVTNYMTPLADFPRWVIKVSGFGPSDDGEKTKVMAQLAHGLLELKYKKLKELAENIITNEIPSEAEEVMRKWGGRGFSVLEMKNGLRVISQDNDLLAQAYDKAEQAKSVEELTGELTGILFQGSLNQTYEVEILILAIEIKKRLDEQSAVQAQATEQPVSPQPPQSEVQPPAQSVETPQSEPVAEKTTTNEATTGVENGKSGGDVAKPTKSEKKSWIKSVWGNLVGAWKKAILPIVGVITLVVSILPGILGLGNIQNRAPPLQNSNNNAIHEKKDNVKKVKNNNEDEILSLIEKNKAEFNEQGWFIIPGKRTIVYNPSKARQVIEGFAPDGTPIYSNKLKISDFNEQKTLDNELKNGSISPEIYEAYKNKYVVVDIDFAALLDEFMPKVSKMISKGRVSFTSGFRSMAYLALLMAIGEGNAAVNSMHLLGSAADILLEDVSMDEAREIYKLLNKLGPKVGIGVYHYPGRRMHIHLDLRDYAGKPYRWEKWSKGSDTSIRIILENEINDPHIYRDDIERGLIDAALDWIRIQESGRGNDLKAINDFVEHLGLGGVTTIGDYQINLKMALRVLVDNFDNPEIKMALQDHSYHHYLKERIESAKKHGLSGIQLQKQLDLEKNKGNSESLYDKTYKAVEMFILTANSKGKDNGRTIAEIVLRENLDYLRVLSARWKTDWTIDEMAMILAAMHNHANPRFWLEFSYIR